MEVPFFSPHARVRDMDSAEVIFVRVSSQMLGAVSVCMHYYSHGHHTLKLGTPRHTLGANPTGKNISRGRSDLPTRDS